MDTWTTLTTDDVLNQFNDSEQSQYDTAKGDAVGAALPDIITKVVNQIRKAYDDGGFVVDPSGQTGTIAQGDMNRAIAIIRWLYLQALPSGGGLLTKERKDSHDTAQTYFMDLAQRKIRVPGSVAIARPGRRVHTHQFDGMSGT